MKLVPPETIRSIASDRGYVDPFGEAYADWTMAVRYVFVNETYDRSGIQIARFLADLATDVFPISGAEHIFLSHDSFFEIHTKDPNPGLATMFETATGRRRWQGIPE